MPTSSVFPLPGGPVKRRLWAPAAAISRARRARGCPRTWARSTPVRETACLSAAGRKGGGRCSTASRSAAACRLTAGYTRIPEAMAASAAFSGWTMAARIPAAAASQAIGSPPGTGRSEPSRASSPSSRVSASRWRDTTPVAARIPSATARSNPAPSLRTPAGARLTTTCPGGMWKPLLRSAALTRNWASRMTASGRPTVRNELWSARCRSTSTRISSPSTPRTVPVRVTARSRPLRTGRSAPGFSICPMRTQTEFRTIFSRQRADCGKVEAKMRTSDPPSLRVCPW